MKQITKLCVVGLAASCASFALAGGPGDFSQAAPQTSMYVAVNGGMANVKFESLLKAPVLGLLPTNSKYTRGDWTGVFGGNLGYNVNKNLAAEFGGYYFMSSKGVPDSGSYNGTKSIKAQPWALYGALKLSYSPMTDVTLFTKAGLGYYAVKYKADPAQPGTTMKGNNFGPMFAVGMAYDFSSMLHGLSANVTYTRLAGDDDFAGTNSDGTQTDFSPSPNLITVGLAYTFPM